MKFSLLFVIFGTTIGTISAVEYKCDFNQRKIVFAGEKFYDCAVTSGSISDESEQEVEDITGRHLRKHCNSDVESLSIKKLFHARMPRDVESYFENIKCLDVYKVSLEKIHQEDLEPYSDLKYLSLANNKLTFLEKYLFQKNPDLEIILLFGNKIKFVNAAFQDLDYLRTLNFNNNECHTGKAENSKNLVNCLITDIYVDCALF